MSNKEFVSLRASARYIGAARTVPPASKYCFKSSYAGQYVYLRSPNAFIKHWMNLSEQTAKCEVSMF